MVYTRMYDLFDPSPKCRCIDTGIIELVQYVYSYTGYIRSSYVRCYSIIFSHEHRVLMLILIVEYTWNIYI